MFQRTKPSRRRSAGTRVFSKGPLPHQHAIDATHFEANAGGLNAIDATTSFRGAVATELCARRCRSARLWAGPFLLVSTSVEVCIARKRALGPNSRRSRELACRALCPAARRCQRCVRARFGHILSGMRFLLFAPREGARFAGGLARCGGELYCLNHFEFWAPRLSFDLRCTGQIGKFTGQLRNHGFSLLPIHITLIFSNQLSQRSRALGSMV